MWIFQRCIPSDILGQCFQFGDSLVLIFPLLTFPGAVRTQKLQGSLRKWKTSENCCFHRYHANTLTKIDWHQPGAIADEPKQWNRRQNSHPSSPTRAAHASQGRRRPRIGLTWECQVGRETAALCQGCFQTHSSHMQVWEGSQARSRTTDHPRISSAAAITQTGDMQPSGRDLFVH